MKRTKSTLHEDLCTISDNVSMNFSWKVQRKSKHIHFMFNTFFFFRKLYRLCDNVEKYGTARLVTDKNIIRCLRFACRITKATNTLRIYLLLFHGTSGYAHAFQCYVYIYTACLLVLRILQIRDNRTPRITHVEVIKGERVYSDVKWDRL